MLTAETKSRVAKVNQQKLRWLVFRVPDWQEDAAIAATVVFKHDPSKNGLGLQAISWSQNPLDLT